MLTIDALPAFEDNYIWLLQDHPTRRCAAVDPGDAAPVLGWLHEHSDWRLTDILVTHHHRDHTGGIDALVRQTGARVLGPAREAIPDCTQPLDDGQTVQVLDATLTVLAVPGHTLGHIAYFFNDPTDPWLLCGDTLFAGGCGRLFEGTAAQMHASLQRLASLPAHTRVYCTHEYTLGNLRFAAAIEPTNQAIRDRLRHVETLRDERQMTLPSRLDLELATNPFLRLQAPEVRGAARAEGIGPSASDSEIFAAIRCLKDKFRERDGVIKTKRRA